MKTFIIESLILVLVAISAFFSGKSLRVNQYIHCEGEHEMVMRMHGARSAGFSDGMAAGRAQATAECKK